MEDGRLAVPRGKDARPPFFVLPIGKQMITATKTKLSPGRLLIDGQWADASKNFDTTNPATGEVLTQIAEASAADVDRAVKQPAVLSKIAKVRGGRCPRANADA